MKIIYYPWHLISCAYILTIGRIVLRMTAKSQAEKAWQELELAYWKKRGM